MEGVKMLAYLVPVLQRMHDTGTAGGVMGGAAGRPSVVILAPTTELARQVGTVCKKLAGGERPAVPDLRGDGGRVDGCGCAEFRGWDEYLRCAKGAAESAGEQRNIYR